MALTKVIGAGLGAVTQDGAATFNESSADVDFRVESNDNTHGIFLDAGAGLVGIGNSNPDGHYNLADDLVIGNGSGGRGLTVYSGNDSSGYIGFNDAEQDSMTAYIQYGHNDNTMTLATSAGASLKIDATGAVTKPNQPAFMVHPASTQTNIAINGQTNVVFGTERFDHGADFSSNNFTAPVTGKYQLQYTATYNAVDIDSDYVEHFLVTSNKTYATVLDPGCFDADPSYTTFNFSVLADMDANDTATININMNNSGAAQMDISTASFFSGYLVC